MSAIGKTSKNALTQADCWQRRGHEKNPGPPFPYICIFSQVIWSKEQKEKKKTYVITRWFGLTMSSKPTIWATKGETSTCRWRKNSMYWRWLESKREICVGSGATNLIALCSAKQTHLWKIQTRDPTHLLCFSVNWGNRSWVWTQIIYSSKPNTWLWMIALSRFDASWISRIRLLRREDSSVHFGALLLAICSTQNRKDWIDKIQSIFWLKRSRRMQENPLIVMKRIWLWRKRKCDSIWFSPLITVQRTNTLHHHSQQLLDCVYVFKT